MFGGKTKLPYGARMHNNLRVVHARVRELRPHFDGGNRHKRRGLQRGRKYYCIPLFRLLRPSEIWLGPMGTSDRDQNNDDTGDHYDSGRHKQSSSPLPFGLA